MRWNYGKTIDNCRIHFIFGFSFLVIYEKRNWDETLKNANFVKRIRRFVVK